MMNYVNFLFWSSMIICFTIDISTHVRRSRETVFSDHAKIPDNAAFSSVVFYYDTYHAIIIDGIL
jgi:hypothetical protein